VDEKDSDAFFTLQEYVDDSQDKRFKKGSCTKSGNWESAAEDLKVTNNKMGGDGWTVDTVETFLKKLDPADCGKAVETGIRILPSLNSPSGKDEVFYIPPGCSVTQ